MWLNWIKNTIFKFLKNHRAVHTRRHTHTAHHQSTSFALRTRNIHTRARCQNPSPTTRRRHAASPTSVSPGSLPPWRTGGGGVLRWGRRLRTRRRTAHGKTPRAAQLVLVLLRRCVLTRHPVAPRTHPATKGRCQNPSPGGVQ